MHLKVDWYWGLLETVMQTKDIESNINFKMENLVLTKYKGTVYDTENIWLQLSRDITQNPHGSTYRINKFSHFNQLFL